MSAKNNVARVRPGTTDGTLNADGSKKKIGGRFEVRVRSDANLNKKVWADDNPEGGFKNGALLTVTMKIVREYASRLGLSTEDTQDVAQEVLLSVLETQTRRVNEQIEKGVDEKEAHWAITGGYVRTVAKSFTGRRVDAHKRHEDSRALKMLTADIERIESAEGRHLEKWERDQLKQDILDNWHDPRHKPNANFDEPPQVVSADAMGAAFAQSQPGVEDTVIEGASAAHRLVDRVEERQVEADEARLEVWNSLVEETGAPAAHKGLLTGTAAAAAKSAIGGNVRKVAEKVLNGTARPSELGHFFAPFGALTKSQAYAVAETVFSRPTMGALMWDAAVDYANRDYTGPAKKTPTARKRVAAKA